MPLTDDECVLACKNIGYDLSCGTCAKQFYTGSRFRMHDRTCETINRDQILVGVTQVRFGPFLAMTSGETLEETDSQRVWRVWLDGPGEGVLSKVATDLPRAEAIHVAKCCARLWRDVGKPNSFAIHAQERMGEWIIAVARAASSSIPGLNSTCMIEPARRSTEIKVTWSVSPKFDSGPSSP